MYNSIKFFMKKYFRLTLLFLVLAEIFSFCGFLYPSFNKVCFLSILIIALIASLKKLEYGIYILLAELFAGSFGYAFFYDFNGTAISLRIGLFLIIMSAWLAKMANKKNREEGIKLIKENKFIKYYFLLHVFLIWGVIAGFLYRNGASNVFFDSNAYIYFGLLFPLITEILTLEQVKNIFLIFAASVIVVSTKTMLLLYVFSHKMYYAMGFLYRWVRDYRFAEITEMKYGFYRVFSQAHIYVLILLFFMVFFIFSHLSKEKEKDTGKKIFFAALYIISLAVIIIDLSRSFWAGGFAGVLFMYYIFIFVMRYPWKKLLNITLMLFSGAVVAFVIIMAVVKFPYPKENGEFSADLLSDRVTELIGESGAKSRWNLLPILAAAAEKHIFLGSGFGATVTYQSSDPRIRSLNSSGEYKTYAFEWGYLDIILKIGILGMAAYLWLIWKILSKGWEIIRGKNNYSAVISGCMIGIILILATSIFSPYMNHPLGIGYIMLCSVIFPLIIKDQKLAN